ncbi:U-megalopygitoxin(8)-Mc8 [Aphomia sociella]
MFCEAKIKINIKIASNKNYIEIKSSGYDNKLVTDLEVSLFNITKENLSRGFRIELGKVPDDIFLKDPTPYYNLHKQFHWLEVKRHVFVKNINILDVVNEKVAINSHVHINNSTDIIKSKKEMVNDVESTIITTWVEEGLPKDQLFYDLNINFGIKQYEFENKWKDNIFKSITTPFGVTKKGYIDVKPGKTVLKQLMGNKTLIIIEVVYSAKLTGNVIANYAQLYGKYHFWAPSIENIMTAAGISNEIVTKERIEIRCYTDPKLQAYDKETGHIIHIDKRIKIVRKNNNKLYKISINEF